MPSLSFVRAANAQYAPSYVPVAVFVGGTSGIGQAMAESFARYTKGNAHIVIVGRNRAAAESIISTFPTPSSPLAKHEFLSCDATLIRNVNKACDELQTKFSKLNYLVLSPGFLSLNGRDETDEGLDKKLSLNYYARWKFIDRLLPLLHKAKDSGEDARVMSVLAAGRGGKIDLEDLGVRQGYGLLSSAGAAATYTDAAFQEYSARHPNISFTHIFPGVIKTPILYFHWSTRLLSPLIHLFATSPGDCSEWMLHALTDQKFEKGVWFLNEKAEPLSASEWATDEVRKKLWEHTVKATSVSQ